MRIETRYPLYALATCAALAAAACNGSRITTLLGFADQALVADSAAVATTTGAAHVDANLLNPWGLALRPGGAAYVANNGSQTVTLYDGSGVAQPTVITLPAGSNGAAAPTGLVYNGSAAFVIHAGANSGAAQFLADGEGGTITGWSPTVDATHAVIAYDDATGGAVYKGLAMAASGGANFLYATDFHNAKVDVFDGGFAKVTTHGGFVDPNLPAGYAPFGIQNIGGDTLIVTYGHKANPTDDDEEHGAGLGIVDEFNAQGDLLKRLVTGGALNAPWGIAMAPAGFGTLGGRLLIGNFGDGVINAYDPATGTFSAAVATPQGTAITVPGLWGIAFGNDSLGQPSTTLFYAAGINDEADGVYGRIDAATAKSGGGY